MAVPRPSGLRILMIHGYTQSGPSFRAKTRALEKAIVKAFPNSTLSYPTGPIPLDPSSIPGYAPSQLDSARDIEAFAWWRRRDGSPIYDGVDQGLGALAATLVADGPFDGVIGFSQGGAAAGLLASLLDGQPERRVAALAAAQARDAHAPSFPHVLLDAATQRPVHPPLKFAVVYAGFAAPAELFGGFYEPKIATPTLHFFGGLDTVVAEERGQRLVQACEEPSREVVVHPGGHFVPTQRVFLDTVVAFIGRCCAADGGGIKTSKAQESVKDVDVPFDADSRL